MSLSRRSFYLITAVSLVLAPMAVATGQSSVTVSPFVSLVPSASNNPLAGFSLTFGGTTGLAFRGGAELSVENPDKVSNPSGEYRPWGADMDAIMFLGGLGGGATVFSRTLSPYVFAGLSLWGGDSSGTNHTYNGWSYGAGAAIPLGLHADLFGEARWRMDEYVLPTAREAPSSKSAFRFGLSFHVGGGSAPPRRYPPRRHRMDSYDEGEEVEVVQAQPAPPPTVIVQQAPAPAPVIIQQAPPPPPVIIQQAPPERRTVINVNLPTRTRTVVVQPERSRHTVIVPQRSSSRQQEVTCIDTNGNRVACRPSRRRDH